MESPYHRLKTDESDVFVPSDNDSDTESVTVTYRSTGIHNHDRMGKFKYWRIFGLLVVFGPLIYLILSVSYINTSRQEPLKDWPPDKPRDVLLYIKPNETTTLIQSGVCGGPPIFLLIAVCSAAGHFKTRKAIRETWGDTENYNYFIFSDLHKNWNGAYGNITYKNVFKYNTVNSKEMNEDEPYKLRINTKIIFVVGKTESNETQERLELESSTYDDIVQEDFIDTYNNLTIKTLMTLKWVNSVCRNRFRFLMKCDDDTFVNVPNLLHVLMGGTIPIYNATKQLYTIVSRHVTANVNRINSNAVMKSNKTLVQPDLLMGLKFCHAYPVSTISSKWYTPFYMYNESIYYPDYLSGSGYVMSSNVAQRIYETALNMQLIHLEDVFVTGICAQRVNIKPRNNHLFVHTEDHTINYCEIRGLITKHEVYTDQFRDIYETVRNVTYACTPPRYNYKYKRPHKFCS